MVTAVKDVWQLVTRHRELTLSLAWQEVRKRHAGQVFGVFWSIFYPVVFLGVYVYIFAFVFRARTGIEDDSAERVLFLLSGLIPWLTVTEVLGRSTHAISDNAMLVKQVVFPIEILSVKTVIATLFNQAIFLVLLFVAFAVLGGSVGWGTVVILPLALAFQVVAFLGIASFLAAVAVYLPDIREITRVFAFLGMFTTPILLPVEQVPELWAALYYANPFSYMIWAFQDALAGGGTISRPWVWGVYACASCLAFFVGHAVFQRLRLMFGNVL